VYNFGMKKRVRKADAGAKPILRRPWPQEEIEALEKYCLERPPRHIRWLAQTFRRSEACISRMVDQINREREIPDVFRHLVLK
jgi:hypothetical protein